MSLNIGPGNPIPWSPFVPTAPRPGEPIIKPLSPSNEGWNPSLNFGGSSPSDSGSGGNLSAGFLQALAFIIVSIGLVLLAGPFPTLVNGILVLILSGVILGHYIGFEVTIQTLTKWLQGQG